MSTKILSEIDNEIDSLLTRLDESEIDLSASRETISTLEQAHETLMTRGVDDPSAAKEALKLGDEIHSAKRMLAISDDIHDQIKSRINAKKKDARQAELAEQATHRAHWELKQEQAIVAAVEAAEPHIMDALKAGRALRVNVSQAITHQLTVAVNRSASPSFMPDASGDLPPESRHLCDEDRSSVKSRHRTPEEKQVLINQRLEREAKERELNLQVGQANAGRSH